MTKKIVWGIAKGNKIIRIYFSENEALGFLKEQKDSKYLTLAYKRKDDLAGYWRFDSYI